MQQNSAFMSVLLSALYTHTHTTSLLLALAGRVMSNECVTGIHITSINLPKLISVRICVCLANVTERGRERKERKSETEKKVVRSN